MTELPASVSGKTMPAAPNWTDALADRQAAGPAAPESHVANDGSETSIKETAPHPLDSGEFNINHRSFVDRDDALIPSRVRAAPPPTLGAQSDVLPAAPSQEVEDQLLIDTRQSREPREEREPGESKERGERGADWDDDDPLAVRPFSSHLITNRDRQD